VSREQYPDTQSKLGCLLILLIYYYIQTWAKSEQNNFGVWKQMFIENSHRIIILRAACTLNFEENSLKMG